MRIHLPFVLAVAAPFAACSPGGDEGEGETAGEGEGEGDPNLGVELVSTDEAVVTANSGVGFGFGVRPDGRWAIAYSILDPAAPLIECNEFGGGPAPEIGQNAIHVLYQPQGGGDPVDVVVQSVPEQAGN